MLSSFKDYFENKEKLTTYIDVASYHDDPNYNRNMMKLGSVIEK